MEKQTVLYTNARVLETESSNTNTIHMYLRRAHYHVFEKSACLFQQHISKYKVVLTLPKNVGKEVLFIGFGMNYLEKVKGVAEKQGYRLRAVDKTHVVIDGLPNLEDFAEWRKNVMVGAEFDYNRRMLQKNEPNDIVQTNDQRKSNEIQRESNENPTVAGVVANGSPPIVQRGSNGAALPPAGGVDFALAWQSLGAYFLSLKHASVTQGSLPKPSKGVNPFAKKRKNPPTAQEISTLASIRELNTLIYELTMAMPAKQRPVYGDRLRELSMKLHEEVFVTVERAREGLDKAKIFEWLARIQGGLIFLKEVCEFKNDTWGHALEVLHQLKQGLYAEKTSA